MTDDVYESPHQTPEQLEAVFQAYDDVGLRATISGHVVDRPFLDTIPFARDFVDPTLAAQADALGTADKSVWLDHCRYAFDHLHGRSGRLNFMVAPSAPQRCTVELMQEAMALAETYDGRAYQQHEGACAGGDGAGILWRNLDCLYAPAWAVA